MGRTYAAKRRTLLKIEELPFSTLTRGAGLNPARVKAREKRCIYFHIFKYINLPLSIETHTVPIQISTSLNREGVELQFDQSYQFEITTDPIGSHYII
jgi:hypothetical protein